MRKTAFFWTDSEQAQERLYNTVILYDGQPHYVTRIREGNNYEDGIPRASIQSCEEGEGSKTSLKKMDSPLFEAFRRLPNIGWMNCNDISKGAKFLSRKPRVTRSHGLCHNNVSVKTFRDIGQGLSTLTQDREVNFSNLMFDGGFVNAHKGNFPSLGKILENIQDSSAIAYSRTYCVFRDGTGLRWLYRKEERVGIFTGVDTLNLLGKYHYLREEIASDPLFTLNNIREF